MSTFDNGIDDFDVFNVPAQGAGTFFSFKNPGDQIQGTYIRKEEGSVDSYGNPQVIYFLKDREGKIWKVSARTTTQVAIINRMMNVAYGTIVGFRFENTRPSKRDASKTVKVIMVYYDEKVVDTAWLAEQDGVTSAPAPVPTQAPVQAAPVTPAIPVTETPVVAQSPVTWQGGLSAQDAKDGMAAINAIHEMAVNKGLVTAEMSPTDKDKAIFAFTQTPYVKENFPTIIMKVAGFSK